MYPSFHHIKPAAFKSWHESYTRRMGYIAAPLMIGQLGLSAALALERPILGAVLYLAAVAATWGATFALSVPLHQKLQKDGANRIAIEKLVSTNWIRTVLWSGIALRHLFAL